jgi:hypothetical protein
MNRENPAEIDVIEIKRFRRLRGREGRGKKRGIKNEAKIA